MGFRNSVQHVQRFMDKQLRDHTDFARNFVDDIVIFSDTIGEHFEHLTTILSLFSRLRLFLLAKKSFIGYPSVKLLGHLVDAFGMATTEERVAAFKNITFPFTLQALEKYIGMTGWLRAYLPSYAHVAELMQVRKTQLLEAGRKIGATRGKRKSYYAKTRYEPTEQELNVF
jgi:hypothetical protein